MEGISNSKEERRKEGVSPLSRPADARYVKAGLGELPMHLMFLFARRFIAGETLDEALPRVKWMKEKGLFTTVDLLGESVYETSRANKASQEYVELVERLAGSGLDVNTSLKLTMLGLYISRGVCNENVMRVIDAVRRHNGFLRVDMEGSDCTDATLELVRLWHSSYKGVGTVIQAMLKRSPADVEVLLKEGIGIRLCKGAYKEPPSIAFKDKRDVDAAYVRLAERLLTSGIYHAIATHDERIIRHVIDFANSRGIGKDAFEFQMLYGIRRDLQFRLVREGWRVRVYIPYGREWLKYTLRRLRERKENLFFVLRHLFTR
jgi:proline dehydrogenase